MSVKKLNAITQVQLQTGTDLMENVSIATRVCKIYRQELRRRVAWGETVERGPLTFDLDKMRVCYVVC